MTTLQGRKHYARIMLEYLPTGLAVYDAKTFCLLEANTPYIDLLDSFLAEDRRGGKVVGHSLRAWGNDVCFSHIINQIQQMLASDKTHHTQEFSLRNRQQEITYWNSAFQVVRDEQGTVSHIIHSVSNISDQVYARQKAEQDRLALSQAKQIIEAERKRLEIIEIIARSVQGTLDIKRVGDIAVTTINKQLGSRGASIHTADQSQPLLRLLCANIASQPAEERSRQASHSSFEKLSLDSAIFLTRKDLERDDPIVIEDIQEAIRSGRMEEQHPLAQSQATSCICLPLRFNDRLEGLLAAVFDTPIGADGVEAQTLKGCATHIAAALAHARLHAAVHHEQKRLRTILDQVPEGILIAEISSGTFSYANQAAADILGIPVHELLDVPLHKHHWHHSAYTSTTSDGQPILPWNFVVVRALCGEHLRCKETLVVQPQGDYVITLASSAPLSCEKGLMTGSIIVLQDITAQKSLEQHKNDFLSVANHELRTPITVIQGFAEVLQIKHAQDQNLDELTQQALMNITEQSEHLTGLIETMLDISRIEQDHFLLRPASCDLLDIVTRAIDAHAITIHNHQILLKLEGLSRTDTLPAHLDKERISQALHNLLSNAIKYSPNGGTIEVGLSYQPERTNEVQLWVKDEGIGISVDAQPHIFKRFYRASNLDPSLSGFGIGLYLVKEIIVRHKGHIWVESRKGHGSTFHITLPLNRGMIDQNII